MSEDMESRRDHDPAAGSALEGEMIERVAQRLFARSRLEGSDDPDSWEDAGDEMREWLRGHARAVIEAMREPTEAMVYEPGDGPSTCRRIWHEMIDAALRSSP